LATKSTTIEAAGADEAARAVLLGDVLPHRETDDPEREWAGLVHYVAAGDQRALRDLYERAHRLVFTFIARLTNNRDTADELTVEVFFEIWKKAPSYNTTDGSVIAWIMNLARSKALERLKLEQAFDDDVLTPTMPLWGAIAARVVASSGLLPAVTVPLTWTEPDWAEVAPGISCKLLATDEQHDRISMLVRLQRGVEYPPHTHAGTEELYLLDGELWIDDRKLYPGDYNRAEPGTSDHRVFSETGCTCVLITSPRDLLH
jgi:DNA-directed RNA polymerase specialized sigma24 family protein